MPDITMCDGEDCPHKNSCYRFMAIPSEFRQSYFSEPPYNKEDKKQECQYYYPFSVDNGLPIKKILE